MRIGFCGAHRTGKSTLADAIARVYGLPMLTNSVSAIVAKYDFDMARDNRLDTGVAMQQEQLAFMRSQIEREGFVSDRTPIDTAAYFLADATAGAGDELSRETVVQYVEKAMALTAAHFDIVILVPPAIAVQPTSGKPPVNTAYQEHIHMLCRGMLFDDEVEIAKGQIMRSNIGRFDRIAACLDFISARFPLARAA